MKKEKKIVAIVLAAGESRRFGNGENKLFALVAQKPLISYSLAELNKNSLIDEIVMVVKEDILDKCRKVADDFQFHKINKFIIGGKFRQDSVYNGLKSLDENTGVVLVHDAARPFVTKKLIDGSVHKAEEFGSVVVAVKAKDTIKISLNCKNVLNTLNREILWQAQTPQTFKYEIILKAYETAYEKKFYATDDASLVEWMNSPVYIFEGNYHNMKITTHEDLLFAESIAKGMLK